MMISIKSNYEDTYKNLTFCGDYEDVNSAFNALWDWMDKCDEE